LKLQWVMNVRVFITYVQNLLVCYKWWKGDYRSKMC
jgi:hypothetical protein